MSGIASVALTIYGAVRKWKQVPSSAIFAAAVICFVLASARIWTTEHRKYLAEVERNTPVFSVRLGSAITTYNQDNKFTVIFLVVKIVNSGADSAVTDWRAHYKSPSLDIDADCIHIINDPFVTTVPSGPPFIMHRSENIMNRAAVPIPRGGMVDGWLPLRIPNMQNVGSDTEIIVTVSDYKGKTYTGKFQGGGTVPTGGIPMPSVR